MLARQLIGPRSTRGGLERGRRILFFRAGESGPWRSLRRTGRLNPQTFGKDSLAKHFPVAARFTNFFLQIRTGTLQAMCRAGGCWEEICFGESRGRSKKQAETAAAEEAMELNAAEKSEGASARSLRRSKIYNKKKT